MIKAPRKIKNYIINPKYQVNFGVYFMIVGLAPISVLAFIIYFKFGAILDLLLKAGEENVIVYEQITGILFDVSMATLVVFVGYSVIAFLSAVVVSHQVAGASVAILKYIDELKKGNYDYERTLRKNDALLPIMDSLKELSVKMKNNKGS